MTTVLITGITGAGGSYLAEHVAMHHPPVAIHGISRWHSTATADNLRSVRDRVTVHECDLTDLSALVRTLEAVRPDAIFHLASHANVRTSFDNPLAVLHNNVMGTANLLEAIRLARLDPVVQHCSTSEVYGQIRPEDVPVTERCPLRAASPYSVSKVTQDLLCHTYWVGYGLRVVRTRMFTYLNPRRKDIFATAFATQVARIELGLQEELRHGNLNSTRTIIDVRDAMAAYWAALERGEPGEVYNIGGRTTLSVGEFLDVLRDLATCPIPTRLDPALLRPADITLQIPDTSKFEAATGWRPTIPFEESVRHLLDHCRREVRLAEGLPDRGRQGP
jgi:GDPmannose 4,6-dehydratase/GDP-4-dehydro-6-deoxy-D-mannose reductase